MMNPNSLFDQLLMVWVRPSSGSRIEVRYVYGSRHLLIQDDVHERQTTRLEGVQGVLQRLFQLRGVFHPFAVTAKGFHQLRVVGTGNVQSKPHHIRCMLGNTVTIRWFLWAFKALLFLHHSGEVRSISLDATCLLVSLAGL